ncbi:MAG: bifunctional (p)ppGpp synthetase/guanosine-3',5'-bis(diphosphate) 3'-pyrophosphohydrolase [Fimbriimonadaceae bacterium]|nr:bifunctional (p)ppGpp synthetase/guanosine-3',5'-bis(diphosphate) 3'-pyrophosphohydrolase [Fimbriimonadaceae bacterium]
MAATPSPSTDPKILEVKDRLVSTYRDQRPRGESERIAAAFDLAAVAHEGQVRATGEPYITHPIEVALICLDLRMDDDSIVAAVLHDVLEDTPVQPEQIKKQFGPQVLDLIEGVTKLQKDVIPNASRQAAARAERNRAAESLRKMLLAMAQDVRVMIIKLADRLHNMRTIDALPPEKGLRIASETMDIYAPLAARLGIWQLKWQLEDLSFKVLHPKEFRDISDAVSKSRKDREAELKEATDILRNRLHAKGITNVQVVGRPKHLFSIFNKVVKQSIPFEQIYDLIALRVIVEENFECYLALGYVHDLWLPMQGLFSDYISAPKPNGYQSLHTKVIGPHGDPIEVQIRTRKMHEIAEFGVAAHWAYKEGSGENRGGEPMGQLRRQLFDWSSDSLSSSDFLRAVSTDLFSEQVFVFTPKGDVLDLPKNSTPVDFAFRVHSELGLITTGDKVNGVMVPLSAKLKNGDVVELITRRDATPSIDWLEFAKSQHARSKLRVYFRKLNKADNSQRGREAVERELNRLGLDGRRLTGDDAVKEVLSDFPQVDNVADLFARVGEGLTTVQNLANKLRGRVKDEAREELRVNESRAATVISAGHDNVMYKRAKCCQPLPGEDIIGYVSRGRGILMHRRVCPDAQNLMEREPERVTAIEWEPDGSIHDTNLLVVTLNRQGLLAEISAILGELKVNVSALKVKTTPEGRAEIQMSVEVQDQRHLQQVMNQVGQLSDVMSILRTFGKGSRR